MTSTYAYTILYVENVLKTIQFYVNAFGFEKKLLTPEQDYGEIETGATTLAFADFRLAKSNLPDGFTSSKASEKPLGFELAFTTPNVEQTMETAIQNGAVLLAKPEKKPWGHVVGYVRDIYGFVIEICTPIASHDS
ncbi:MAG: VOC family protein [Bacteroidota bacterium]